MTADGADPTTAGASGADGRGATDHRAAGTPGAGQSPAGAADTPPRETRRKGAVADLPGAVVVAGRDQAPTWPEGLSVEVLRDELGIDVRLGAAALAATRES